MTEGLRHRYAARATTRTLTAPAVDLYDVLGRICFHERLMVTATIIETFEAEHFTAVDVRERLASLIRGQGVQPPTAPMVDNHLRNLIAAGLIGVVAGHSGSFSATVPCRVLTTNTTSAQRWQLYQALTDWALRHPDASLQQILVSPRGLSTSPARVIVAWYRLLAAHYPEPIHWIQLIGLAKQRHVYDHAAAWLITLLTSRWVLHVSHKDFDPKATVALCLPAVAPIRDLITVIDAAETYQPPPHAVDLPTEPTVPAPDKLAALLEKAHVYASTRSGNTGTAQLIAGLVNQSPQPLSAAQISQHLAT
jgi:hypothetical protein